MLNKFVYQLMLILLTTSLAGCTPPKLDPAAVQAMNQSDTVNGADRRPFGDYQKTCVDCSMAGQRLNCNCADSAGDYSPSSVYVTSKCVQVTNNNGNLQCKVSHSR